MRLRFTIRDLLWLTLVVALVMGWSVDHRWHRMFTRAFTPMCNAFSVGQLVGARDPWVRRCAATQGFDV